MREANCPKCNEILEIPHMTYSTATGDCPTCNTVLLIGQRTVEDLSVVATREYKEYSKKKEEKNE